MYLFNLSSCENSSIDNAGALDRNDIQVSASISDSLKP